MEMTGITSDSDSDSDLGFANLDLTGVDFDQNDDPTVLSDADKFALELELETISRQFQDSKQSNTKEPPCDEARSVLDLAHLLAKGSYVEVLRSAIAQGCIGFVFNDLNEINAFIGENLANHLA